MNAQKKMTHFIVKCKIRNGNSFLFLSRVLSKPVSAGDAVEENSNINFRVSINANEGYLFLNKWRQQEKSFNKIAFLRKSQGRKEWEDP